MADNLRITTPLNPNDSVNKTKPNRGSDPLATIDPTRVIKKDAGTSENANKSNLEFAMNSNSVFQTFVQKMQQTPTLSKTLQKLLAGVLSQDATQASQELNGTQGSSIEALLSKLASEIQMDESQILSNILFQQQYSTSFNSELFQILKNISEQVGENPETKDYLGRFLKAYDGYFSSRETMSGIINQLKDIILHIPRAYREEIESYMNNFTNVETQSNLETNLKLLKEDIIPALSKYVATFNDMGETREKITLLVHDISILNISSKEEVAERFSELLDYCRFNLNITQSKLTLLKNLFSKEMQSTQKPQNEFLDALINVLKNNSNGEISNTRQTMLQDTITTLLLDQSTFMPFTHIFLPINYNGTFMFSEIWIEKNKKNKSNSYDTDTNQQKLYLSFEIQNLGSFQAAIGISENSVECHIDYPEKIKESDENIKTTIANIFINNGFNVKQVVSLPKNFKVENEVIKKIYEGRNSIDVTI